MQMSFLVLPSDYITFFFSEWLNMFEVATLDVAMTNRSNRERFTFELSRRECILVGLHAGNNKYVEWLRLRSIKVKCYFIHRRIAAIDFNYVNSIGFALEELSLNLFEISVMYLLSLCSNLRELELIYSSEKELIATLEALPCPHKLVRLDMIRVSASMSNLSFIAAKCPNLSALKFNFGLQPCDETLESLTNKFHKLEDVELQNQLGLNNEMLEWIVGNCITLSRLNIHFCGVTNFESVHHKYLKKFSYRTYHKNFGDSLSRFISKCSNLEELDTCTFDDLNASILQNLSQTCPKVSKIGLYSRDFYQALIDPLLMTMPWITHLSLDNVSPCDDSLIDSLVKYCIDLQEFDVADGMFSDVAIQSLVTKFTEVRVLNLRSQQFGNKTMQALSKCEKLKILSIVVERLMDSNGFLDSDIINLVKSCTFLELLSIHTYYEVDRQKAKQFIQKIKPRLMVSVDSPYVINY